MALPQHPARVQLTVRGGEPRWLADPPYASAIEGGRWRLVDDVAGAGIWPWQQALSLEREARQPWRGQLAQAIAVDARTAVGVEARVRALGCGLPDADQAATWCSGRGRSWSAGPAADGNYSRQSRRSPASALTQLVNGRFGDGDGFDGAALGDEHAVPEQI